MFRVEMPDGELLAFSGITAELDEALRQGIPVQVTAGGQVTHQYQTRQFEDGYLLDNCPLNIIFGQGWLPGQVEALRAAGFVPYCPECPPGSDCYDEFYGRPDAAPAQSYTEAESYPPGSVAPFTDGSCPEGFTPVGRGPRGPEYCAPPEASPQVTVEVADPALPPTLTAPDVARRAANGGAPSVTMTAPPAVQTTTVEPAADIPWGWILAGGALLVWAGSRRR